MAKTYKSYQIVDSVVLLMLQNDKFLNATNKKRNKELTETVEEQFVIGARQAQRYIKEAREEILKLNTMSKEEYHAKALRRKEFLFGKTVESKDYKTAHQIEKDLAEFLDLYPVKKLKADVTNKNIDLDKFTNHGLMRIVRGDQIEDILLDPESVKLQ